MNLPNLFPSKFRLFVLTAAALTSSALAYPPTPPAVVTGMVRGEYGFRPEFGRLEIALMSGSTQLATARVQASGAFTPNFQLVLPLDLNPATGRYRTVATQPKQMRNYRFEARQNGRVVPITEIEQVGQRTLDQSGGKFLFNFTLGQDVDGDTLPDGWETFQASKIDGFEGDPLELYSRDGDQDGDGMSDFDEYVAGTFASVFEDAFNVWIQAVHEDGSAELSFLGIDSKSYRIQGTADGENWTDLDVTPEGSTGSVPVLKARNTKTTVVTVAPLVEAEGQTTIYRLLVD